MMYDMKRTSAASDHSGRLGRSPKVVSKFSFAVHSSLEVSRRKKSGKIIQKQNISV